MSSNEWYWFHFKSLFDTVNHQQQQNVTPEESMVLLPHEKLEETSIMIVFKKIWPQALNVFSVFFVTLSLFPGSLMFLLMISDVKKRRNYITDTNWIFTRWLVSNIHDSEYLPFKCLYSHHHQSHCLWLEILLAEQHLSGLLYLNQNISGFLYSWDWVSMHSSFCVFVQKCLCQMHGLTLSWLSLHCPMDTLEVTKLLIFTCNMFIALSMMYGPMLVSSHEKETAGILMVCKSFA